MAKVDDEVTTKAKRHRSPNYPAVGLRNAVERVEKLYKADGKPGSGPEAAFKHIGFSSDHGQAQAVMSALKKFGLLEDKGGRIVPTKLAIDVFEFPADHPRHMAALRDMALMPSIYSELVESFREHSRLPSDTTLKPELVTDKGFNPKAVDGFLADFRDTLEYAGLLDGNQLKLSEAGSGGCLPLPPSTAPVQVGSMVQWLSGGQYHLKEPKRVAAISEDQRWVFVDDHPTGIPMDEVFVDRNHPQIAPPPNPAFLASSNSGPAQERLTLDEGPVVISWPDELGASSVQDFSDWIEVLLKRLRRKAGLSPDGKQSIQRKTS